MGGGVPRSPFEVTDGGVEWTFSCTSEQALNLLTELTKSGIPHNLISTRQNDSRLLTKRQTEVLEASLKSAYYDVPRLISITKLAAKLGIAKSTLSATLQRIESKVMNGFESEIRNR